MPTQPNQDLSAERLRIAERCLIGAAADRPELLTDENWQHAMMRVYEMLRSSGGWTVREEAKKAA